MPVRWDNDRKSLLFVTIMNTHQLTVDCKKVVEAWPEDEEKPTERAIKEILGKIKKQVAKAGGASASGTPSKVKISNAKPKSTPRSAKKRKKVDYNSDSDSPSPLSARKELEELEELGGGSLTPKRSNNTNAPTCLTSNDNEYMGVTDSAAYPTPADTASPAAVPARRSTPRRAASVKVASYVKEEQNVSEDEDGEGNDQDISDAESDAGASDWYGGAMLPDVV